MVLATKNIPKFLCSSKAFSRSAILTILIILIVQFVIVDSTPAGYWNREVTRRRSEPRYRCNGKLRRVCEREARKCFVPSMASRRAVVEWMRSAAAEISFMERMRVLSNANNDNAGLSPFLMQRFVDIERESEYGSFQYQKPSCRRCQQLCWN